MALVVQHCSLILNILFIFSERQMHKGAYKSQPPHFAAVPWSGDAVAELFQTVRRSALSFAA
jgi:hypothetical protein